MIVVFAGLLSIGTYTRKETAAGLVRSAAGEVRIAAPIVGVIKRVAVRDGEHVRVGQTLVTVDTSRNGINGQPVDQSALDSLDGELANLDERLRSLGAAASIDQQGLPNKLASLRTERVAAVEQERSSKERLTMAKDALAKLEPVAASGYISGESMRRHKEEVLVLQQAVADARGLQARLDGQINDIQTLIARQPMTVAQQRGELLDLIARTRRERDAAAGQRGYAVTAPTSGVVTTVQAGDGQPIDPQTTLMTVSTGTRAMMAELFVPSRAIGFIEEGQKVRLRYDAFPYQRFGVGTGRVKAISSTVLRPDQVTAAIRIEEPVYRVVIALDESSITAYGHRYRIRPGFALNADIILDRRSFAQWLLDPILALRGRL